jgi:hypothetical protein
MFPPWSFQLHHLCTTDLVRLLDYFPWDLPANGRRTKHSMRIYLIYIMYLGLSTHLHKPTWWEVSSNLVWWGCFFNSQETFPSMGGGPSIVCACTLFISCIWVYLHICISQPAGRSAAIWSGEVVSLIPMRPSLQWRMGACTLFI